MGRAGESSIEELNQGYPQTPGEDHFAFLNFVASTGPDIFLFQPVLPVISILFPLSHFDKVFSSFFL